MRTSLLILTTALFCALSATTLLAQVPVYTESATALGIDHIWSDNWSAGDLGSGVAIEDFDGDGDLDLFLGSKADTPLRVFRNDGGSFFDLTDELNLCVDADVKQVLFADLDNDGHRDLLLSTWIPNVQRTLWTGGQIRLFSSDGSGGFAELTSTGDLTGVTLARPTGVAAGDIDLDGDLDLYIGNWTGSDNRLLINDGGFQFRDEAANLGVDDPKKSYQVALTDLDGNGWLDIVVAEDKRGGMTYYQSNGDGTFTDRTDESGMDGLLASTGAKIDGMGLAIGDYDNDGDRDVYCTNIFDGNVLYRNDGNANFTDVAIPSGTQSLRVGWGCEFFDADLDGRLDLYVVDFGMSGASGKADRLYRNLGNGLFTDVGPAAGIALVDDGFGMASGDLNGDGSLDVITVNGIVPVRVFLGPTPDAHWIHLDLKGTTSNRDGVGAIVTVHAGGQSWVREQRAGNSYLSFSSHALEFGLGDITLVDRVHVRWPSGQVDRWTNLDVDMRHDLVEGNGIVPVLPVPQLVATRTPDGTRLEWTVDAGVDWERFEIDRITGFGATRVIEARAERGRNRYEGTDAYASEARYRVTGWSQGEAVRGAPVASPLPLRTRLELAPATPNPFNPRTTLRWRGEFGAEAHPRIVDLAGRTVREWPSAPPADADGWHRIVWDGNDGRGRRVASGPYRFVLRAGDLQRSTALTLVR